MEAQWRRAAVYVACRDASDRLLLTRLRLPGSTKDGFWTMPGGGMEWGEDLHATATRELLEETGLRAELGAILGVWSQWIPPQDAESGQPGHVVGVVLEAVAEPLPHEGTTDRAEWFERAEIATLPHVPLVDYVLGLLG